MCSNVRQFHHLVKGPSQLCFFFFVGPDQDELLFLFVGPDQDELVSPAHHMVVETTSRDQGSELSSSTMIPQMTVVADVTRSEDWLCETTLCSGRLPSP